MTQRESGQDFDPKHRIVGAIVVVALAVIFIPMILSNRESSDEPRDSQVAAPGESSPEQDKVAVTKIAPPEPAHEPAKTTPPTVEKTDSAAPAKSVEPKTPTAARPAPAAAAPQANTDANHVSRGWVVQVGTFSNAANATRLEQKLREHGQPLLVEHINFEGNAAVRLRVGPFRDRAAATKALQRINKEVGVKGVVLAYP